jgi:hypothetical protein
MSPPAVLIEISIAICSTTHLEKREIYFSHDKITIPSEKYNSIDSNKILISKISKIMLECPQKHFPTFILHYYVSHLNNSIRVKFFPRSKMEKETKRKQFIDYCRY